MNGNPLKSLNIHITESNVKMINRYPLKSLNIHITKLNVKM
jgi:hypothetical protein